MAVDYQAKQGDFKTEIRIALSESANSFNFTQAATVKLTMVALGSNAPTLDRVPATSTSDVTSTTLTLHYSWDTADLDVSGYYYGEVVVTLNDGTVKRFPSSGYFLIEVVGKLA
jgi:hypothetical protein